MDLLVSLCGEIFSSAFLLSPSPCVTDRPYWAITGVTPSFVWGQFSHRFGAVCILCPPHYLVCTGTERIAPCPAPPPLLLPSPPLIPFSASPLWNEHFSRPETFNLAPFWRKLIETCPTIASFLQLHLSLLLFSWLGGEIVRGLVCSMALNAKKRCYFSLFPFYTIFFNSVNVLKGPGFESHWQLMVSVCTRVTRNKDYTS